MGPAPPITASSGRMKPPFGLSAFAPFGEIPKPIPRTAFSIRSGAVSLSSSVRRSRSDISATSTSATPGKRSTAPRTLAAQAPQSIPVTRHSRCAVLPSAISVSNLIHLQTQRYDLQQL